MVTAVEQAQGATGATRRSRYHLTEEQLSFFDENGYLILRNWIPQPLLERLRAAGDAWIRDGIDAGPDHPHFEDYVYARRSNGRVMYRVNYLHNKGQAASLELLGSPEVLAVAESMCGPSFVPTYESMVFKQGGDGAKVPWHQDAVQPRSHRIFNYDLYLDRSGAGAGALRIIPGTQRQQQDICTVASNYGWDAPGVVEVEMAPGDVLLHDTLLVHGSPQVEGKDLRRTIYYEFRAAEQIISEGPWDREWVDRRLRLIGPAIKRHRDTFPHSERFEWNISDEYRPQATGDEETELKIAHVVHSGGSYCSAGSSTGKPRTEG